MRSHHERPGSASRRGLVAALCFASAVAGQGTAPAWGLPRPQSPPPSTTVPPGPAPQNPQEPAFGGQPQVPRDMLDPIWTKLPEAPRFQGFPVFPSRLSGYGTYPPGTQQGIIPLLPPATPESPGWPSWVRLRGKAPLPYAPDLALLVRHSDRVWWRGAPDDAFVPLYHHDKLCTLAAGSEVVVRQSGEFELLLHNSGRLVARGPTELCLSTMSETEVVVDVRSLTNLRVQANLRTHTLVLPDRSRLRILPDPADAPVQGPSLLLVQRADEPGRFGGRATIFNAGPRDALWEHALGVVTLPPGHRVTMFLHPPETAIPAAVVESGADAEVEGDALRFTGPDGAHVSWCGARFALAEGRSVRFEPLLGQPFEAVGAKGARPKESP